MSDSPPQGFAGDPPGRHPEDLTPERIEEILGDFRVWLQQVASASGTTPARNGEEELSAQASALDLSTLLGQFIALRHEVNLQTRAVRNQQEQNAETLRQLSQALLTLRHAQGSTEQRGGSGSDDQVRPLLKVLVDLYDALAPAQREVERMAQSLLPDLDHLAEEPETPPEAPRKSFWARWFGRGAPPVAPAKAKPNCRPAAARLRQLLGALLLRDDTVAFTRGQGPPDIRAAAARIRSLLGSLLTGYTMSLQRLERVLEQQDLEPIPCVGEPFDPELMEVVEAVPDTSRPAGEVLDEIRRGYLWRGRVFRFALVRVAQEKRSEVRSQKSE